MSVLRNRVAYAIEWWGGAFSLRGMNSDVVSVSRNHVSYTINVFCVSKSLAVVSVMVVSVMVVSGPVVFARLFGLDL